MALVSEGLRPTDIQVQVIDGTKHRFERSDTVTLASLSLDFSRFCIADGAIALQSGVSIIDWDKLQRAHEQFDPLFKKEHERRRSEADQIAPFPHEGMEQFGQEAVRDAIKTIAALHLVDEDTIDKAQRFVSPDNTVMSDAIPNPAIAGRIDVSKYRHHLGIGNQDVLPIPKTTAERNEFITLLFGPEGMRRGIYHLLRSSHAQALPITDDDAGKATVVSIAGHEAGHALDFVLAAEGIDTEKRAQRMGPQSYQDIPASAHNFVHKEVLARSIQAMILSRYLQDQMGWTDEQVERLNYENTMHEAGIMAQVESFRQFASQQGYDTDQTFRIVDDLMKAHLQYKGNKGASDVIPLYGFYCYFAPIYTPEQTQALLSR